MLKNDIVFIKSFGQYGIICNEFYADNSFLVKYLSPLTKSETKVYLKEDKLTLIGNYRHYFTNDSKILKLKTNELVIYYEYLK